MKKLKDINWNQIYYFYEVAQSGSMSKGAQVIGVSVSTVSQQIGHLERFVNSPLFVRGRAHLRLTKEGETLFQLTREMFETGHRLLDTISPNAIGGYSVRVGIQESLTIAIGFPFVSRYWDLYAPYGVVNTFGVQSTENAVEKLLSGQLDWAILFQPGLSSKLESREIATTTVHFCCSSFINDRYEDKKSIFKALP
ncbi:MAG: LysR family transcriptional regulator, partial [Pseudobdellovibrionaceae bacterium]